VTALIYCLLTSPPILTPNIRFPPATPDTPLLTPHSLIRNTNQTSHPAISSQKLSTMAQIHTSVHPLLLLFLLLIGESSRAVKQSHTPIPSVLYHPYPHSSHDINAYQLPSSTTPPHTNFPVANTDSCPGSHFLSIAGATPNRMAEADLSLSLPDDSADLASAIVNFDQMFLTTEKAAPAHMYVPPAIFGSHLAHYHRSHSFPVETLLDIFVHATGSYMDSRTPYLDTLRAIVLTCKRWHDVAYSFSDLWATYELSPHRKRFDVVNWVTRLAKPGLSLDLHLRFDDLFSFRHPPSTIEEPRLGSIGTIHAIRPFFWKARRLYIACDQYSFPHMIEALQLTIPTRLVSLTLNRVILQQLTRPQPLHSGNPRLFHKAAIPMLQFLRIIGTTPGWDDLRLFGLLKIFVAHAIPHGLRPSGLQLFRLLETMRMVEKISLRDVCYNPLPFTFNRFSILPMLVELDLYFKSSIALAQVLARFQMPALRTVTTYFDTPHDLDCLMICSGILASITTFAVTCNAKLNRFSIADLWSAMPLLERLDLSRCGGEFFDTLFAPGMPYFFPRLHELTVSSVPPTFLRVYLQLRLDAHIPLRRVTLWRIDPVWFAFDIQWMMHIMSAANVFVNPTGLIHPRSWILHD
jgi:hypothetical protein